MATSIISPTIPPPEPLRCNQEVSTGLDTAAICGALADVMTETGPRCNACLSEFGGEILTAVNHLWIKANVAAARELDQRFKLAQIGNGLFVRVGRGKGGR